MAALTDQDRFDVWADYMREIGHLGETLGVFTKAELRSALNAADDWADANTAAYNAALPQPFRGAATTAQKALLLSFVIHKRWIKGV